MPELKTCRNTARLLSPLWAALRAKISDQSRRERLSGLIRFASAKAIDPNEVNEEVLDDYMNYRAPDDGVGH